MTIIIFSVKRRYSGNVVGRYLQTRLSRLMCLMIGSLVAFAATLKSRAHTIHAHALTIGNYAWTEWHVNRHGYMHRCIGTRGILVATHSPERVYNHDFSLLKSLWSMVMVYLWELIKMWVVRTAQLTLPMASFLSSCMANLESRW